MVPQLVDDEAVALITYAYNHNIPVYAVTSRDSRLIWATHEHLAQLGITFTQTDNHTFDTSAECPTCVSNGVVFTGFREKGDALIRFMYTMCSTCPDHIVFIDDRRKHVENVVTQCHEHGFRVTGLRYSACDAYYI